MPAGFLSLRRGQFLPKGGKSACYPEHLVHELSPNYDLLNTTAAYLAAGWCLGASLAGAQEKAALELGIFT